MTRLKFDWNTVYHWGDKSVCLVPMMLNCSVYMADPAEMLWVYCANDPDKGFHVPAYMLKA